jgi:hypothetical protein
MTSRRMVRCSRCGGEWGAVEDAELVADADQRTETEHEHEAVAEAMEWGGMDRLAAASTAAAPRRTALMAAWLVTVLLLIGGTAATVTWRAAIMREWPPSSRILGLFGHDGPEKPVVAAEKGTNPAR